MKTKKNAVILILSLWVLTILVIFALGLGNRCSIALKLSRHQRDRLRTSFLINAGINLAINELETNPKEYDSLAENWANNKKIFSVISFEADKKEFCKVSYTDSNTNEIFGILDEEGKININNAAPILIEEIFISKNTGIDAKGFFLIFNEWINSKEETGEEKKLFKNEPLKTKEELLLVLEYFFQDTKKAQETYTQVEGIITVYGDGKVNINTVAKDVLYILAKAFAETDEEKQAAESLADKIIKLRDEKIFFKNISGLTANLSLETAELSLWNKISAFLIVKSNYFRIETEAFTANANKKVAAVFSQRNRAIVYWHEN